MSRHLVFNPDGSAAGNFPGAISANSVYDLASIMDEPFDIRSGVDPIAYANLIFSAGQSGLSSQGLLTSNGVSGLGAAEIGVVSGDGYQIAVGQTVDTLAQIEIEYNERGTVEHAL